MKVSGSKQNSPELKVNEKEGKPVLKASARKKDPAVRPTLSKEEIRAKVAQNALKKDAPLKDPGPKMGFEKSEAVSSKKDVIKLNLNDAEPVEPPLSVGLNDPNDPATAGKLKEYLRSGGITFNDREKEVLGKILS